MSISATLEWMDTVLKKVKVKVMAYYHVPGQACSHDVFLRLDLYIPAPSPLPLGSITPLPLQVLVKPS